MRHLHYSISSKRNVAETVGSGSNAQLNIVGKQRSRGMEFDLNGPIADNLSVAANYTYTKVNHLKMIILKPKNRWVNNFQVCQNIKHLCS